MSRSNKPYILAAAGVVIVTLSELAAAQTSGATSGSTSGATSGVSGIAVSTESAAATQLISVTSLRQMLTISNALSARTMTRTGPGMTADAGQRFGMAAGGADDKWNVWTSLSGDRNTYDNGVSRFGASASNWVLGGDYALTPTVNLGLSVAADAVDGSGGLKGAQSTYSSAGYTFAPYVGWQFSKDWSLDGTLGWGEGDFTSGGTTNQKRVFYGANLNYAQWYGNWQLSGKGSYLYGEEKYDNAQKNKVDQWRIGGQAAYWMDGLMPYVGLAYSNDSRSNPNIPGAAQTDDLGKSAWLWSLGLNFISIKNSATGGIVYSSESGRSHSKSQNLMANINLRF